MSVPLEGEERQLGLLLLRILHHGSENRCCITLRLRVFPLCLVLRAFYRHQIGESELSAKDENVVRLVLAVHVGLLLLHATRTLHCEIILLIVTPYLVDSKAVIMSSICIL